MEPNSATVSNRNLCLLGVLPAVIALTAAPVVLGILAIRQPDPRLIVGTALSSAFVGWFLTAACIHLPGRTFRIHWDEHGFTIQAGVLRKWSMSFRWADVVAARLFLPLRLPGHTPAGAYRLLLAAGPYEVAIDSTLIRYAALGPFVAALRARVALDEQGCGPRVFVPSGQPVLRPRSLGADTIVNEVPTPRFISIATARQRTSNSVLLGLTFGALFGSFAGGVVDGLGRQSDLAHGLLVTVAAVMPAFFAVGLSATARRPRDVLLAAISFTAALFGQIGISSIQSPQPFHQLLAHGRWLGYAGGCALACVTALGLVVFAGHLLRARREERSPLL